ncbi:MAG TPA: DUF1343 domain-containing protein [Flavipsychrobacter sp.]|nr:DUF1343 domain-containing protein [Flavipsychrobacter sp.]
MRFVKLMCFLLLLFAGLSSEAKKTGGITPGAACIREYLPLLKGKKVALVINQTSIVGTTLLLDTLLSEKVKVQKIFVPEHGFRGTADAGAHIRNDIDSKTGLPVISLYGNNKKPKPEQLKDIDIVVFDLQDVGTRFYTYISTLEYVMEACAENGKQLIVLDRPNPNGHYVDGPVLEKSLRSFVGMQSVPVVYGMTIGEYAKMLAGERWTHQSEDLAMNVITCKNYDHTQLYKLPVAPSPNLKEMNAIYLYPSLCFFEGTVISVGRGTEKPFQQWGNPLLSKNYSYSFVPESTQGASQPMFEGSKCYGETLQSPLVEKEVASRDFLQLSFLIKAYRAYPVKEKFFNDFFEKLAGTKQLRQQIISAISETDIRASWQTDIDAFKKIRKKYLLYKDFE